MLRLLSDENFNGDLVRGIRLRDSSIDLVRVQDVGLASAADDAVLAWAAGQGRLVLSHDRATLPVFAFRRVLAGQPMPGAIIANDGTPRRQIIDEIVLLATCSEPKDWDGRVLYLPL
jgi:predicted nuclease of predicted toxin-antitoxin system